MSADIAAKSFEKSSSDISTKQHLPAVMDVLVSLLVKYAILIKNEDDNTVSFQLSLIYTLLW